LTAISRSRTERASRLRLGRWIERLKQAHAAAKQVLRRTSIIKINFISSTGSRCRFFRCHLVQTRRDLWRETAGAAEVTFRIFSMTGSPWMFGVAGAVAATSEHVP
jgi:hypothetical protein